MDDEKRVAEIRQRAEAATEGVWQFWSADLDYKGIESTTGTGMAVVATAFSEHGEGYIEIARADADFLSAAREDIPWLLDRLRAAEARIECARCGEKMIRQDENGNDENTQMEVCSRCCHQIHDGLTKAAEARAAEAEAVIAEVPHSSFCKAGYGFAEPCDCWKSRYRAGVDR